jgi:hypothetical protein
MVFPANWQLATTRSASRALHILFCALFGATLILLLMVLKFGVLGRPALIFWKSPSPDTKFFLVVSAPYIVSMFLLLIPNFYTRALAFGMACVTAAVFTYWEGLFLALLLIAMVFESSPSMRLLFLIPLSSTVRIFSPICPPLRTARARLIPTNYKRLAKPTAPLAFTVSCLPTPARSSSPAPIDPPLPRIRCFPSVPDVLPQPHSAFKGSEYWLSADFRSSR